MKITTVFMEVEKRILNTQSCVLLELTSAATMKDHTIYVCVVLLIMI